MSDVSNAKLRLQYVKVDAGEIGALAGEVSDRTDAIEKLVTSMATGVDGLASSWAGPNHDRFVAYFDERYERLDYYLQWLRSYAEALGRAQRLYQELPGTLRGTLSSRS